LTGGLLLGRQPLLLGPDGGHDPLVGRPHLPLSLDAQDPHGPARAGHQQPDQDADGEQDDGGIARTRRVVRVVPVVVLEAGAGHGRARGWGRRRMIPRPGGPVKAAKSDAERPVA
jgi:hypothetical protein